MQRKTYYFAAFIFIILGVIGFLINWAARWQWLTVIVIGCFIVGVIYSILGSRIRD